MQKIRLRFFLDYGTCFWGDHSDDFKGDSSLLESIFSPETQHQIDRFLREFDQHYDWGCPPSEGWSIEDCWRFNREYKRILGLALPELKDQFMVCIEQFDLVEEEEQLAALYQDRSEFIKQRKANYYHWTDDMEP